MLWTSIKATPASSLLPQAKVRICVGRGWPVIDWPVGTKGSKKKGWPSRATTDAGVVRSRFNGDGKHNVGVLLGPKLNDVDLDCAEALAVGGYFLPETRCAFGRLSTRMAHRIYKSNAGETIRKAVQDWEDPERPGKPMLELRVGGGGKAAQTIFPGSVHESGEPIEFEPNFAGDPAEVDGAELIKACSEVAAACLIARAWPTEGGHRPAQVIGGFLARAGWNAPRVDLFVSAVMAYVGGPHASDHARTARNAAEAYAVGSNSFGLPALSETFGEKRAKAIAKWLGYDARKEKKDSADTATDNRGQKTSDKSSGGTQAQKLIDAVLDEGVKLYHAPDGIGFADISVSNRTETWAIRSSNFKLWVRQVYYRATDGAPSGEAMETALGVLEAKALFDGEEMPVYLRCAEHDGNIYIDLGDRDWRMVEVSSGGWRIITAAESPCRFRRSNGALPLPIPVRGGSIKELAKHLNTTTAADFVLAVSWVLAALRGRGPYPVGAFAGEQGTGKSTACRILRGLVDPFKAPVRSMPKDKRDLAVAAHNAHVVGVDNLSGITGEMSDALCSLSTGGGFSTRGLYSNDEEQIFEATRPILLNGIDDVATRGDLADRTILISLKPISDTKRRTEASLWRAFNAAAPGIFGTILDALAHGLKHLPTTKLDHLPRMADYAIWIAACEGRLWQRDTHMRVYAENRKEANKIVLESDPVAVALRKHLEGREELTIDLTDLLAALGRIAGDTVMRSPAWPQMPRGLTAKLKRLAGALRSVGITITPAGNDATSRRALFLIKNGPEQVRQEASKASEASEEENREIFPELVPEGLAEGSPGPEGLTELATPEREAGEDDDPYDEGSEGSENEILRSFGNPSEIKH